MFTFQGYRTSVLWLYIHVFHYPLGRIIVFRYYILFSLQEEGDEFWCHMRSALLHPVGWSQQVGHKLSAGQGKLSCFLLMEKYCCFTLLMVR